MVQNRKAQFNYEVKDTLEAGIVLTGAEVKAIRDNRANLQDAFVKVVGDELLLLNADIAKYKYSNDPKYDAKRTRKLLVHKSEMYQLASKSKQWGGTLIPLKIYFVRGRAKLLIGVARGRKERDKRNLQKERDLSREFHREIRRYMVK